MGSFVHRLKREWKALEEASKEEEERKKKRKKIAEEAEAQSTGDPSCPLLVFSFFLQQVSSLNALCWNRSERERRAQGRLEEDERWKKRPRAMGRCWKRGKSPQLMTILSNPYNDHPSLYLHVDLYSYSPLYLSLFNSESRCLIQRHLANVQRDSITFDRLHFSSPSGRLQPLEMNWRSVVELDIPN